MFKNLIYIILLTTMLQAKDNIEIYNHFANANHLIIEGRMLYKKRSSSSSKEDGKLQNLWRKIKHFNNNEIKNESILIFIEKTIYTTVGDDEGYFKFDINLKVPLKQGYQPITLKLKNNSIRKNIDVPVITQKAVGIISDFDDTVIISDVTNKLKLSYNLLLKNYKQRKLIPTMKERFQKILSQNPKTMPTPLFFVTGSPQQLSSDIEKFLDYHHFPSRIVITKKIHGYNIDPLLNQFKYKVDEIETLFKLYPNIKWTMFGDSGEKDEEVYRYLAEKYPKKVKTFYIRDVKNGDIVVKK